MGFRGAAVLYRGRSFRGAAVLEGGALELGV
jgi:hypothetical protein